MSINVSGEYDPGKAAYLRNPNFAPSPVSDLREVQPMAGTCLLCVFGQGDEHADGCKLKPRFETYVHTGNCPDTCVCGGVNSPNRTVLSGYFPEGYGGLGGKPASGWVKHSRPVNAAPAVHIKRDPLEGLKPTPHLDGIAQQAARMESAIQRGRFKP